MLECLVYNWLSAVSCVHVGGAVLWELWHCLRLVEALSLEICGSVEWVLGEGAEAVRVAHIAVELVK